MEQQEKIISELYQHLGRLFYAVANADKKIHPKEIDALLKDVRRYWLDIDEGVDETGSDAAYQIEIVFDWLMAEEMEPQDHFKEFSDFYRENKELFSPRIKELTRKTARDIAGSFAGKNKSELILLAKIDQLLA
ncbi:hypothetical protein [Zeaxanthinibacter enoshimensis]|uniref:Tellurite resistance protein TerB n=1 Tax=Zeaxanthinibacter enoshimensis TaxID=392009 RepID=A0A4R6TJA0_9FLAO|nr:hypothetical protein [Zeaxanthinibacter enoshimensis]TDQ30886.1 hypothetical protein CLV82_1583 [Zeaxanthinibacter enoshimensis]